MESSRERQAKRGRRRSANVNEDDLDEVMMGNFSPPSTSRSSGSKNTVLTSVHEGSVAESHVPNVYSAQHVPPLLLAGAAASSTSTTTSHGGASGAGVAGSGQYNTLDARFEFDVYDAKLLRLQFAKHDLDRDGRLDAADFLLAYQSCKSVLPALNPLSTAVAEANFYQHQKKGFVDLNGFLMCINKMYHNVMQHQRKAAPGPAASDAGLQSNNGMVAFGADPRKATAASSLRGLGHAARDWFGVNPDTMAHVQDDFIMRKTLEREPRAPQESAEDAPRAVTYDEGGRDEITPMTALAPPAMPHRLIYNEKEALAYYKQYVQKEQEAARKAKGDPLLDDAHKKVPVAASKAGGANARRSAAGPPLHNNRRLDTMVRWQLRALPTFAPNFIYIISFLQFSVLVVVCALAYTEGSFAAVGLGTTYKMCSISPASSPPCPDTFECSTCYDTSLRRPSVSNMWIGPNTNYLLTFGAKYTLCMRSDSDLNVALAATRGRECGLASNPCLDGGWAQGKGYSCCTIPGNGRSGMTDNATCAAVFGSWLGINGQNMRCDETFTNVVIRPCCVGNTGTCQLLTQSQCFYINGTFHATAQLCSDVMCLGDVCKMRTGPTISASRTYPNVPDSPNQWWRFITPLFLHAGVLHFAIVIVVQLHVGAKIEKTAGFLRTMLIYFISGIGGYIISGSFTPQTIDVGANPAVFGLLAVLLAELLQSWQLVINPLLQLTKLTIVLAVAMALGTFPYLNNFSHIGGFLFGFLAAIVFLPYITFGKWDVARKLTMIVVCLLGLIVLFVLALLLFYLIQNTSFCSWCHYLDCVPYSSSIDCSA